MDCRDETFVSDVQQCQAWSLINTAALCFDNSVFDLVAHAEAVTTTNNVCFVDEFCFGIEFFAIERNWPAFFKAHNDVFGLNFYFFVVMRNTHDWRNDVHAC